MDNSAFQAAVHALHEVHMHQGQDKYFTQREGQLSIRPAQRHWIETHLARARTLLNLNARDRFVDLGCGEGYLTLPLAALAGQSIGYDFAASALWMLQQQTAYQPRDLLLACSAGDQLPLPDEWATKLLCNHVLEHVLDDDAVLKEMYRVLQPGGLALIGVPLALTPPVMTLIRLRRQLRPQARLLQLEQVEPGKLVPELVGKQSHIRFYSLAAVQDLVQRNGFRVRAAEGIGFGIRGPLRDVIRRQYWLFSAANRLGNRWPAFGDGLLVLVERQ